MVRLVALQKVTVTVIPLLKLVLPIVTAYVETSVVDNVDNFLEGSSMSIRSIEARGIHRRARHRILHGGISDRSFPSALIFIEQSAVYASFHKAHFPSTQVFSSASRQFSRLGITIRDCVFPTPDAPKLARWSERGRSSASKRPQGPRITRPFTRISSSGFQRRHHHAPRTGKRGMAPTC